MQATMAVDISTQRRARHRLTSILPLLLVSLYHRLDDMRGRTSSENT